MSPISPLSCESEVLGIEASEVFGAARISSSVGWAVLEKAGYREILGPVEQLLPGLPRELRRDLLDRLLVRLALQVLDLPASRIHHHAHPYGLLRHLLEVGGEALRVMEGYRLGSRGDRASGRREPDRSALVESYGAFVIGLFHDLGKVQDLRVRPPQGGDSWNPLGQPLASYCRQFGAQESGPEWWVFRQGRGLEGHVLHLPYLVPVLLPEAASRFLGPKLFELSDALIASSTGARVYQPSTRTRDIAEIVREADRQSARMGRPKRAGGGSRSAAPREPGAPSGGREAFGPRIAALIEEAIQSTRLPLNVEGGLLVGPRELILPYPDGLDALLTEEAGEGNEGARASLLRALGEGGCLSVFHKSGRSVENARVAPRRGKPWDGPLLALDRRVLTGDLPLFPGRIHLHRMRGVPAGGVASLGTTAMIPSPPTGQKGDGTSSDELYSERVALEMDAHHLLDLLERGLREGFLRLNRQDGEVFRRGQVFYFLEPSSLARLLSRRGIAPTLAVLARAHRVLVATFSVRSVRIRVHPDSPDSEPALAIPAELFLGGDEAREQFGHWRHPIRSEEDPLPPEESGATVLPLEMGTDDVSGQSAKARRLLRMSRLYEALWETFRLQSLASERVLEMAREFAEAIPNSRLVLFPKRKTRGDIYYALFWGVTIAGPQGTGKSKRYVEHQQGLTRDLVLEHGRRSQEALYFDFDRRRLALNAAYRVAMRAQTVILNRLRKKFQEPAPTGLPVPFPPTGADLDLGVALEGGARWGWAMLGGLEDEERELELLARSTRDFPSAGRLRLDFRFHGSALDRGQLAWALPEEAAWLPSVDYRKLRRLRLLRGWFNPIFAAEKKARVLLQTHGKSWERFEKILAAARTARQEAVHHLALASVPGPRSGPRRSPRSETPVSGEGLRKARGSR